MPVHIGDLFQRIAAINDRPHSAATEPDAQQLVARVAGDAYSLTTHSRHAASSSPNDVP